MITGTPKSAATILAEAKAPRTFAQTPGLLTTLWYLSLRDSISFALTTKANFRHVLEHTFFSNSGAFHSLTLDERFELAQFNLRCAIWLVGSRSNVNFIAIDRLLVTLARHSTLVTTHLPLLAPTLVSYGLPFSTETTIEKCAEVFINSIKSTETPLPSNDLAVAFVDSLLLELPIEVSAQIIVHTPVLTRYLIDLCKKSLEDSSEELGTIVAKKGLVAQCVKISEKFALDYYNSIFINNVLTEFTFLKASFSEPILTALRMYSSIAQLHIPFCFSNVPRPRSLLSLIGYHHPQLCAQILAANSAAETPCEDPLFLHRAILTTDALQILNDPEFKTAVTAADVNLARSYGVDSYGFNYDPKTQKFGSVKGSNSFSMDIILALVIMANKFPEITPWLLADPFYSHKLHALFPIIFTQWGIYKHYISRLIMEFSIHAWGMIGVCQKVASIIQTVIEPLARQLKAANHVDPFAGIDTTNKPLILKIAKRTTDNAVLFLSNFELNRNFSLVDLLDIFILFPKLKTHLDADADFKTLFSHTYETTMKQHELFNLDAAPTSDLHFTLGRIHNKSIEYSPSRFYELLTIRLNSAMPLFHFEIPLFEQLPQLATQLSNSHQADHRVDETRDQILDRMLLFSVAAQTAGVGKDATAVAISGSNGYVDTSGRMEDGKKRLKLG